MKYFGDFLAPGRIEKMNYIQRGLKDNRNTFRLVVKSHQGHLLKRIADFICLAWSPTKERNKDGKN